MLELQRVPVIRVLVPFTTGSLLGLFSFLPSGIVAVSGISLFLWTCMAVAFRLMDRKPAFLPCVFCLTAFGCFMAAGCVTGMAVRPRDPGLPVGQKVLVRGKILDEVRPASRFWRTEMNIRLVATADSGYVSNTVVRLYLAMPADSVLPEPGETWQFCGSLYPVESSGNPGEPDYEKILKRQNCWYRLYADGLPGQNRMVQAGGSRVLDNAVIRNAISDRWEGRQEERSLLKAVCLGDRSELTPAMEEDFSMAGGMHILAVSGLHMGLIWWVLSRLLSVLVRITGKELFRTLIILLVLWTYAWITGFSSSVCRAVTMFSLLTAGRWLDRRSGTLNGIIVSAFLLLVLNPNRIMDVGFQLSYMAVLGIITLQPVFRKLVSVRNRVLRWILDATAVSIAAQLATAPLVAYYFHQLPSYAILTNLVAVPLLSCIITLFVVSVPFFATGCCTWLFNWPLTKLGALLNRTMTLVGSLPGSVIRDLKPGIFETWCMVLLFGLMIFILHDKRNLFRYLLMAHLAVYLGHGSWDRYRTACSAEFVAAHFYGGSLLVLREGNQLDYYMWAWNKQLADRMKEYAAAAWVGRRFRKSGFRITGTSGGNGSVSACRFLCPGAWQVGNDRVRGIVLSGGFDPHRQQVLEAKDQDFILLSGEPRLGSGGLLGLLSRSDVVVDGSNRTWYCKKLERFAGEVPGEGEEAEPAHVRGQFHLTGQRGAYVKRW